MIKNTNNYLAMVSFVLLSSFCNAAVSADGNEPLLDRNLFSIGFGISDNSISNPDDDETGFQLFAAYDLNQVNLMDGVRSSVEFGIMDYGFSRDSTGIWATYVADGIIGGQIGWLARAGLDIGDDSGLMVGAGVSYIADERTALRIEYVVRDEVDSLQFNFLYHL
ncbi:MAG: hypothetical protein OEN02_10320 [Gammaproteobacteria bacterium]|nr:hypothetical protein [Gammaproteobacteria bacterium]MDH3536568.1 hypothetical protein [Gammaproteobacteria bacterium]